MDRWMETHKLRLRAKNASYKLTGGEKISRIGAVWRNAVKFLAYLGEDVPSDGLVRSPPYRAVNQGAREELQKCRQTKARPTTESD